MRGAILAMEGTGGIIIGMAVVVGLIFLGSLLALGTKKPGLGVLFLGVLDLLLAIPAVIVALTASRITLLGVTAPLPILVIGVLLIPHGSRTRPRPGRRGRRPGRRESF